MTESVIDEQNLIDHARLAMENAYSPYSQVKVGAALLTKSGMIFSGCNIENGSFGLTVCAERTAVGNAITAGEKEFVAIAIANSTNRIFQPCGACRQVLSEFASNLKVIMVAADDEIERAGLDVLLPGKFRYEMD
ncbi:MAG: cytidine deaminase [bacterium]